MMKKTYSKVKRTLAFVLAVTTLLLTLPSVSPFASAIDVDERVADASTINDWKDIFGQSVLQTDNAGYVWTDKSVFTPDTFGAESAFAGTGLTADDTGSNFLVALSAMAANKQVSGKSNVPTDTVLVLDVSGSMNTSNNKLADEMVQAANETIASLLSTNPYNRVGVILYSWDDSNTGSNDKASVVVLPLGRYTTGSDKAYLTYTLTTSGGNKGPGGKPGGGGGQTTTETVSIDSDVRIEGTGTAPSSTSKTVVGGTYIQRGLSLAASQFAAVTDTTVTDPLLGTVPRTPILVLMSDGAPTVGTTSFTNPEKYTMGDGTATSAAIAFATQLTATYVKEQISDKYNTESKFYTLGIGVDAMGADDEAAASVVLDYENVTTRSVTPGMNNDEIKAVNTYNSLVNAVKTYWEGYNSTTVGESYSMGDGRSVTKVAGLSSNYVDEYFEVESSNMSQGLIDAFKEIVHAIQLQSSYYPTLVEGPSEHLDGYVTFVDRIGEYMEVTGLKGLLIGGQLYSGACISANFVDGGGLLGTKDTPTELGKQLVLAVQERLGLATAEEARAVIELAYQYGQLSYTDDNNFSNYIGWYANAKQEFLGFWHDGITTMPDPADPSLTDATRPAYIIRSYGYLGAVDAAHGVKDSDMMYAHIQVREDLATGATSVIFSIPASLIPLVTYDVALEGSSVSAMTVTGAESPISLVYEVDLRSDIDEITVHELVDDGYAYKNSDGSYNFYSNQWESGAHYGEKNAFAYFAPSKQNERYYYTEDSFVYTDTSGTLYNGASAPTGTMYRAYQVYSKEGGSLKSTTHYEQISAASLALATAKGDGSWYIPAGTIHTYVEEYVEAKAANTTATFGYSQYPFVDSQYSYYVGSTLGNNGRLTLMPETGLKVSKEINHTDPDTSAVFAYTVATLADGTYVTRHVAANGTVTAGTVTASGGVASFTLKHGESLYIIGLAAGNYTVTEAAHNEYKVESVNGVKATSATVSVAANNLPTVDFVNVPKGDGDLTITKEIIHSLGSGYVVPENANTLFTVEVTLAGYNVANRVFTAVHTGDPGLTSVTTDAAGKFTFTLRHNETLEVFDLPEDTVVTIVEQTPGAGFTAGYWDDSGTADDGVVTILPDVVSTAVINNTYVPDEVDPVNVELNGIKNYNYLTPDWNEPFTFYLQKESDGAYTTIATKTVTSSADPTFSFSAELAAEVFSAPGVYNYRVIEEHGGTTVAGVTYDPVIHSFGIYVGDTDMDGKLEITKVVSYHTGNEFAVNASGNWDIQIQFNNEYNATGSSTYIDILKELVNPSASTAVGLAGYQFGLYDGDGNLVFTSESSDALGNARLMMTYAAADIGTYVYTLKEIVPASPVHGMTYSTQEYTVTVEVVDNGDGTTSATATVTDGEGNPVTGTPSFTNSYDPDDAVVTIPASKVLTGRELNAGEFSFRLYQVTGAGEEIAGGISRTATNAANGTIGFGNLVFDKVGDYYFALVENAGTLGGVTYDATIFRVHVVVSDIGGTLTATYNIYNAVDNNAVFHNTYTPASTTFRIEGTKLLSGRTLINEEFTFTLTEVDALGNVKAGGLSLTAKNYADGSFHFEDIVYTATGDYYYRIAEQAGASGLGLTYDESEYLVHIRVTDPGTGTLAATAVGDSASGIVFSNVYKPNPITTTIPGTKNLTGKVMTGGEFTFEIHLADEHWAQITSIPVATAVNASNGVITFPTLTFDTVGTYRYLVKEVNAGQTIDGITYDDTVYRVGIHVTDNGMGYLVAETHILIGSEPAPGGIVFRNSYAVSGEASVIVGGNKHLTGRDQVAGEFQFAIYETDSTYTVAADALPVLTTGNTAVGTFTFDALTYTAVGEHYYVVRELDTAQPGVTYGGGEYQVYVAVTDNGVGGLNATKLVNGSTATTIAFSNSYDAEDATLTIPVNKVLTGRDLAAGEFTFKIMNGTTVLATGTNNAAGVVTFDNVLTFDTVGTYTYTVVEEVGALGGVTYDETVYTAVITVVDLGGQLKATYTVNGVENATISFTNEYDPDTVYFTIGGLKVLAGRALAAGEFTFVLTEVDSMGNVLAGGEQQTTVNTASGAFKFEPIEYHTVGDYYYRITEQTGTLPGVTYDGGEYTVHIRVTDDGVGNLVATAVGGSASGIQFINSYDADDATLTIPVTKTLVGRSLKAGEFTFYIKDGGVTLATGTNNAAGVVTFDNVLTFDAVGTYTYTVVEAAGTLGGVTYDTTVYTVTVTVTDVGGALEATYTVAGGGAVEFTNTYTPAGTSFAIGGTKVLTGRDLAAGEFTFLLVEVDEFGTVIPGGKSLSAVNAAGGLFAFDAITYTAAGDYYYKITEQAGTLGGISYDGGEYTVHVRVTDNEDGQLVASAVGGSADSIIFTNGYAPAGTTYTIGGTKVLTGRDLAAGEFTFLLVEVDEHGTVISGGKSLSAVNAADGTFAFDAITYTAAGDYYYKITEQTGTLPGVTYDGGEYTVHIRVTDNKAGQLVATAVGGSADNIEFTNSYDATDATLTIPVTKTLNGRALAAGEFTFVIRDGHNVLATGTNNAAGVVTFDNVLTFDTVGTYMYLIEEKHGELGGISYDGTTHTAVITVEDVGGALEATYTIDGVSGATANFVNEYDPHHIHFFISGTKYLTGRDLAAGEFTFVLTEVNGDGTVKVGGKNLTAVNEANGTFHFPEIMYEAAGDYYYKITEQTGTLPSVTYDGGSYTVHIQVTDDGAGNLTAHDVGHSADGIEFNNVYDPVDATLTVPVSKELVGRDLNDGEFTFYIKDGNTVLATGTNNTAGVVTFDHALSFDTVGSYTYTVVEKAESLGGVTYDDTVYTLNITVEDLGGELKATYTVEDDHELKFTNTYTPAGTSIVLGGTKFLTGRDLAAGEFTFLLVEVDSTGAVISGGESLSTVNGADGTFTFDAIDYTKAGDYYYKITEQTGTLPGVTYDGGEYTVHIRVTDDGVGNLSAEAVNESDKGIAFNNSYDAEDTTLTIPVTKVLTGRDLAAREFYFRIRDGHTVLAIGTNDVNGVVTFNHELKFDTVGTYTYTVEELQGFKPGVDYDSTLYTVVITVEDVGGALAATYDVVGVADDTIKFTNGYAPAPTTLTIPVSKVLTGRDMKFGEFVFYIKDGGTVLATGTNNSHGEVVFGKVLEFNSAGTYTYTVVEAAGTAAGVDYDDTVYTVVITVEDIGGQLEATYAVNGGGEIEFTNSYDPTDATLTIPVNKVLTGRDLAAGEFTFYIKDGATVLATGTNNAAGVVTFDKTLTFDTVGTYTYTVVEAAGTAAGMDYDDTVYTVVITVEDIGGQLEATYVVTGGGEIEFTNSYDPTDATLTIPVNKVLTGRDLAAGEFTFIIRDGHTVLATGTNDAAGVVTFDKTLTFDTVGTYMYLIEEVRGDLGGVSYDGTTHTAVITVEDVGGALKATYTIDGVSGATASFVNEYDPQHIHFFISGTKYLTGREITAGEFTFVLTEVDSAGNVISGGKNLTTVNDANGTFHFPEIKYEAAGDYYYRITEQVGTLPGMTYDGSEYIVHVQVTDDGAGNLTAHDVGHSADGIEFNNVYDPTDATLTIPVSKVLTGRDMKFGEFVFYIKDGDTVLATGTNNSHGGVVFGKDLSFDTAGTYTYTVVEKIGTEAGMDYDETVYTVVITVEDKGGYLEAGYEVVGGGEIKFTNSYDATDATLTIPVNKTLTGRDMVGGEFTFKIMNGTTVLATGTNDANGAVTFDNVLTFDTVGTYTYTVVEEAGTQVGMTYDDTVYTVVVTVEDIGGQLEATYVVTGGGEIEFTNSYNPVDAILTIPVTKTLVGRTLAAGEFTFVIRDGHTVLATGTNDASGEVTFDKVLTFDAAGTYTYLIEEVRGELGGISYDGTTHTVVITVEDVGGVLEATYTIDGVSGATADFTNEYDPHHIHFFISGTKYLIGRDLTAGEFTFVLTEVNSDGTVKVGGKTLSAVNEANGTFHFPEIMYEAAGDYYYKITEQTGTLPGVTYDGSVYTVHVQVTDDGMGNLTAHDVGHSADGIEFNNVYDPTDATLTIPVNKALIGRDMNAGEFTFKIMNGTTVLATGTNNAAGVVTFDKTLTFDTVGTYTYTVAETIGTAAGVTYDDTVYTVVITVEDKGGYLEATYAVVGGGEIEFTNVYTPAPATLTIPVNKTLTGRDMNAGEFTFYIKDGTTVLATGTNDVNGVVTFDKPLTFDTVGTYTYTVVEEAGALGTVTYDDTVYTVVITVEDKGGQLEATYAVNGGGEIEFSNSYTPNPTTLTIPVSKVLTGRDMNAGEFTFKIMNGSTVLATGTNNAAGEVAFDKVLTFTAAGTYTYTVVEEAGTLSGVSYDSTVYTVVITVEDVGGQLVATYAVTGGGEIEFTNVYTPAPATLTIPVNKVLTGRDMNAGEFTFKIMNGSTVLATGTNNAAGEVTFDKVLAFTAAGTYTYTVVEEAGTLSGVSYDSTVYTVVISVEDVGGQLEATYVVDGGGKIEFTNSYTPAPTQYTIGGLKNLTGRGLKAGEFTFILTEVDSTGAVVEGGKSLSAVNGAGGTFFFDPITYSAAGDYYYRVTEQAGTLGGVTYDDRAYIVHICVTDDGEGSLHAEAVNNSASYIVFNNGYQAGPVGIALEGNKTLSGKTLSAGQFTFELFAADEAWVQVGAESILSAANDETGAFRFDELTFDRAGTYRYLVKEKNSGLTVDGITYDSTEYRVEILVTDPGTGTLEAQARILSGGEEAADGLSFNNTYTVSGEATVILSGTKALNGRDLTEGEFLFAVYETGADFVIAEGAQSIMTAANAADGTFTFEALKFTEPGTHYYVVVEENNGVERVTYDTARYCVTVEITDNGMGGLNAAKTVNGSESAAISFINTFIPRPDDIQIYLTVKKTVKNVGEETIGPEDFIFVLKDAETEAELLRETSNGSGVAVFYLTYTEEDAGQTFRYTISEINDGREYVVYSEAVHTVTVEVSLNENNELETVMTLNEQVVDVVAADFENTYEPPPGGPKTGDESQLPLWMALLVVSGTGLVVTTVTGRKKKEQEQE